LVIEIGRCRRARGHYARLYDGFPGSLGWASDSGRHDDSGRLRIVGRTTPLRSPTAAQLGALLEEQSHAWPEHLPTHRWGAPRTAYTRVRPDLVVEVSADLALDGLRWRLWVPETPQTSRDLLILVDEPAEAVVSFDLVDLGCGVTGEWSCGSGLPQGAVRPVIVVVAFEFV
jgi:hypothetical protein